jgi:protein transport protein SEC31
MAGAIDLSFSTTACLEIFSTDFASDELEMPTVGKAVPATERFHRLVWGTAGSAHSEEMRLGVIAGGLVDGTVNVYNPAKIVDGAPSGAIITKLAKHQGAVRGLDFNSFSPNLLASGAEDGELCIWDLANPTKPSLYPALKSNAGGPTAGEVSYLAWNHKVQHILASSSLNGSTVVWDLKRQRPVISFTDPNSRRRCSALQWNPEVATQLIVASDDDRSCSLQVWDLRNSISPAREFVAHSKGVLAMAWNLQDPSLLLTCGKDNRTLCWDTEAGEVISELPASANWNFDVQWSKTAPGILSTSSFDGKVTLHNLQRAGATTQGGASAHGVNSDFSGLSHQETSGPKVPMKRAPKWMKRPCGATFGFGGKLVAHGATLKGAHASPGGVSIISVKSESKEGVVVKEDSSEFENAVKSGDSHELINFCNVKKAHASEEDREAWTFMSILFADDARREMLRHLEFGDALEAREKSLAALSLKSDQNGEDLDDTASSVPTSPELPPVEDNDAFFDNLGNEPVQKAPSPKPSPKKIPPPKKIPSPKAPAPTAADFEIQRALIVGDYKAAVAACEKAERYADALILAAAGGPELWAETQAAHIARVPRPYMQVAAAVVGKNLTNLVKARPVSAWKETLALLCTYAPGEEWGPLAEVLAEGLANSGDHKAAMLCYICAGNVDAAIKYWLASLPSRNFSPKDLYSVVEKAVMMTRAAGQSESTQGFTSLITNYAEMLSSQGELESALDYLGMVPGTPGEEVNVLRNRIIRSGISTKATTSAPTPSPVRAPAPTTPAYGSSSPYQSAPPQQQTQASAYGGAYSAPPPPQSAPVPQRPPQQTPMIPSAYAPQTDTHSAYGSSSSAPAYGGMPSAYGAAPTPAPAPVPQQPKAPPGPPPRQTAYDSAPVESAYSNQGAYGAGPAQPSQTAVPPSMTAAYNVAAQVAAGNMGAPPPMQSAYGASASAMAPPPTQMAPVMPAMMVPSPMQMQPGAAPGMQASQPQQRAPPPPPASVAPMASFDPTPTAPPPSIPKQPAAQPTYAAAPPPSQPAYAAGPPPGTQSAYGAPPPASAAPPPPMQTQPMQPQAQQQPQQQQAPPPPPAAPAKPQPPANCSMETVDTSKVSPDCASIVQSLRALYDACVAAAASQPAKRKEMEDSSKRLGVLLWKLANGDVSPSVTAKLKTLAQALDVADFAAAQSAQMALTTADWDECSGWLNACKRLTKFRATLP